MDYLDFRFGLVYCCWAQSRSSSLTHRHWVSRVTTELHCKLCLTVAFRGNWMDSSNSCGAFTCLLWKMKHAKRTTVCWGGSIQFYTPSPSHSALCPPPYGLAQLTPPHWLNWPPTITSTKPPPPRPTCHSSAPSKGCRFINSFILMLWVLIPLKFCCFQSGSKFTILCEKLGLFICYTLIIFLFCYAGKLYKSKVCFTKHIWEHSVYWDQFKGEKNHDRVLSIQVSQNMILQFCATFRFLHSTRAPGKKVDAFSWCAVRNPSRRKLENCQVSRLLFLHTITKGVGCFGHGEECN